MENNPLKKLSEYTLNVLSLAGFTILSIKASHSGHILDSICAGIFLLIWILRSVHFKSCIKRTLMLILILALLPAYDIYPYLSPKIDERYHAHDGSDFMLLISQEDNNFFLIPK